MKRWITIMSYKGFKIQILDGAGSADGHDYMIDPPLGEGRTYSNIGQAVQAIDASARRGAGSGKRG